MTTTFHYGKYVDSETPITGVISNNNILREFISDEICIDCEQIYSDIDLEIESETDEGVLLELEESKEYIECDSSHIKLFGDWIEVTGSDLQKEKNLCWYIVNGTGYYPDKNGEFAAIEMESETQIVFSKYTKRAALCSPCFPGQGDLDSSGEYLAYDLPKELKYSYDEDKE